LEYANLGLVEEVAYRPIYVPSGSNRVLLKGLDNYPLIYCRLTILIESWGPLRGVDLGTDLKALRPEFAPTAEGI
jgi:hypothetical protein